MPIIYNMDQGSPEWKLIRMGIPTASEFGTIMTGPSRQFSAGAHKYACQKVAEMITGIEQGSDYISAAMENGHIVEQEAADSYEWLNEVKTQKIGFVTDDNGFYGCSPDRFVGEYGTVEIKSMNAADMIPYLINRNIAKHHIPQIQGGLLTTGRLWCDWHLYNPDMPRLTIRTWRNERYIADLRKDLEMFHVLIMKKLEALAVANYIDLHDIACRATEARAHIKGEKIDPPYLDEEAQEILAEAGV